jgi:hypothetical protein
MNSIRITVLLAFSAMLCGCGFVHDEQLTGNYRLIAVDVLEQMGVDRSLDGGVAVGRINETVFAVWDQRYIVAKQHPRNNRTVTNYYYLEMAKDSSNADPGASVTGPLTEAEFNQRKTELKLPEFTRTFRELQ